MLIETSRESHPHTAERKKNKKLIIKKKFSNPNKPTKPIELLQVKKNHNSTKTNKTVHTRSRQAGK